MRPPHWLSYGSKSTLVDILTRYALSRAAPIELQRRTVALLRQEVWQGLQHRPSALERVKQELVAHHETCLAGRRERQARQAQVLQAGRTAWLPGRQVSVFDEKMVRTADRVVRTSVPWVARVVEQRQQGRCIVIESLVSRPWHEAGGHWIYQGQRLTFCFDPTTCRWLREGLTGRMVQSSTEDGRDQWFALPYTRQYLLWPSETALTTVDGSSVTPRGQNGGGYTRGGAGRA